MKLKREYQLDPVLKAPLKVVLERDFLWIKVYYKDRLIGEGDKKKMRKGFDIKDDEVGKVYLKRTKKNPPSFEVKVNDYYAEDSENHPNTRMRSAAIFFGVVTFLALTGNINLYFFYLPFPYAHFVPLVLLLAGVMLLFKQVLAIHVAGIVLLGQQIACFQFFRFSGEMQFWLQILFDVIFLIWLIREWNTVVDTRKHQAQKEFYENSEVLDV